jgi:Raf kinase inhibitor-like YbhB/YbcL family protein
MYRKAFHCLILVGVGLLFVSERPCFSQSKETKRGTIQVVSTAFKQEEMIPKKYTCQGKGISPPLTWTGLPQGVKSIALIMDDPDAPGRTYVHWVVYNMPPNRTGLPEKVRRAKTIPGGGQQGVTTNRKNGYLGPCPPRGVHRYFFKLYALDTQLGLPSGVTKKKLLRAMEGHILAQGELMGKYSK